MAVQNSLTKADKRMGLTEYLTQDAVKNQINSVIGGKDGQRFISAIISAVNTNPVLKECTNQSILSGALLGESLKLSPSPQLGHYYLVPFNDNKGGKKVAQFQLGYKGYIQLAIRSGQYKKLNVMAIKEGELEYFDPLNEDIKINLMVGDWDRREQAETIGYYAFFELTNGFRKAIYWSRNQMEAHALKYSKGYQAKKGYTFWEKDFDGMAYKTMLRQLISKWGIMSIEMMSAMDSDMAVINADGTKDYVENDDSFIDMEASGQEEQPPHQPASEQAVQERPEQSISGQGQAKQPAETGKVPAQAAQTNDVAAALFGNQ